MFSIALYISLSVCAAGLVYRITLWFRTTIGTDTAEGNTRTRLLHAGRTAVYCLFSRRIFRFIKTLFVDILLQADLFRSSKFRWLFHFILLNAFILLLLLHAMDDIVTRSLFPEYESTLNPFMCLRNFLGMLVLLGILFFMLRRSRSRNFREATSLSDVAAILLLAAILLSGFLLEAVQIVSSPLFDEMVADYLGSDDPEEVETLKAYWAKEYGVVFPEAVDIEQADRLAIGKELHAESCAACHVKPENAFISYPLSQSIRFIAVSLNSVRADIWLWHVHYMVCFIGLALLPFSKFFHIFSVPLNLLVQSGRAASLAIDPNRSIRQAVGMDACTHCGICSLHCSVMPIYRVTANPNILPSEKLLSAKAVARGKRLDHNEYLTIAEGNFTCTDCYRCTQVCPSGIDLHDLWQASRKALADRQYQRPDQWVRERSAAQWASLSTQHGRTDSPEPRAYLLRNMAPESFSNCVQCTVCANVCPVVSMPDSLAAPEATPQQVMNLLRLDMRELALASRMVWDCMTCYMCQEHCPQGIRVADILYELRSLGARQLETVRFSETEKKSAPDLR